MRSVYLEKLTEFSRLLRQEGLAVGLQETADACAILEELGFEDRNTVRLALCAVYAKSQQEQRAFYRAFDGFFISIDQKQALREQKRKQAEEMERRKAEAQQDFQVQGKPMEIREDLRQVYMKMSDEKREELRQLMEKNNMNIDRSPELYTNFIRSVFMRFLLEQQMMMEDADVGCESDIDPELGILYRDVTKFKDTEIPRATALIAKIAGQLNAELASRKKRAGHKGSLDFKRTIRKGLETGGCFYRLSHRQKRLKRRKLVLLCDVSGSMLQFSEFALRFIKSLSDVAEASETFVFSEKMQAVDAFSLQNMDAFRDYVKESGLFGKGTDLGHALERLLTMRPPILGPATTLLILTDTKTVDVPRAARALNEVQRNTGKVLILNPIPEQKWPYVQSILRLSPYSQMVPCSTLQELAYACRKLMLS